MMICCVTGLCFVLHSPSSPPSGSTRIEKSGSIVATLNYIRKGGGEEEREGEGREEEMEGEKEGGREGGRILSKKKGTTIATTSSSAV
jgi:hypothetical protein